MQIKEINLYALSSSQPICIRTVANDTDRWLKISLDVDLGQATSAVLYFDKNNTEYSSQGTISDGHVLVQIPALIAERWHASLRITYDDGKVITTFPFEIRTEENYAV